MNENKVPGIWKWTVILLMACNVGLMLTLWLKPKAGGGLGRPESPREYVIRSLNFTGEQVKQYDRLIREHRIAMKELGRASMDLRQDLFGNLKNAPGGLNTDSLAQLIANNQKEIELVTYNHFAQVRANICTETQKLEFDKIIEEVTIQMNGGMRGGPPPPGGPGADDRWP